MPIGRPNALRLRYRGDHGNMMDHVYINMENYVAQHPQWRNMFEDGEHHGYGKASSRYLNIKLVIANVPLLLFPFANTIQSYHVASIGRYELHCILSNDNPYPYEL